MAAVGNLTITGNVTGGLGGQRSLGPYVRNFSAGADVISSISLTNGNVTVNVPSGATSVVILPPNLASPAPNPGYSGTITLKGNVADTGVPVSVSQPTVVQWDTATVPSSFILTATASGTAEAWFA